MDSGALIAVASAGALGVIDLLGPYRKAFTAAPPKTIQVADPFHAVKLADGTFDDIGRRVQNITSGKCGFTNDPLDRIRRRLLWAHERVTDRRQVKLSDQSAARDPHSAVLRCLARRRDHRGIFRMGTTHSPCATYNSSASFPLDTHGSIYRTRVLLYADDPD